MSQQRNTPMRSLARAILTIPALLMAIGVFASPLSAEGINVCTTPVLKVTPPHPSIYEGESIQLTATLAPNASGTYTWTQTGDGRVDFAGSPPPPEAPPGSDPCETPPGNSRTTSCVMTPDICKVTGTKPGIVTIKIKWGSCDTRYCDAEDTIKIRVLDNGNPRIPKMPLGGKYTRVDVHGVPMPDPSPTGEGEQDRIPNMAYTDMYALQPTYAVTDALVPMEGGELALEFRRTASLSYRNYNQDILLRSQQYPAADLLGLGWDANVGSRIIVKLDKDFGGAYYKAATVTDETGGSFTYIASTIRGGWQPDVVHSFSNQAVRNRLVNVGANEIQLIKPHGTVLTYKFMRTFYMPTQGGCSTTLVRSEDYYRLEEIVDRNGNRLKYEYHENVEGSKPNGDLVIKRVVDPAHPERNLRFDARYHPEIDEGFGGDTGWRLHSVTDPLGRATTFNFADSGALKQLLREVVRPPVTDGVTGVTTSPTVSFTWHVEDLTDLVLDPIDPPSGSIGTNRWVGPREITDARGNTTSFTYKAEWFPSAIYAGLGAFTQIQKLRVATKSTIDGTATFTTLARTPLDVHTTVVDTRGTTTSYDFDSVAVPAQNWIGGAIFVTRMARHTSGVDKKAIFNWSQDASMNLTGVTDLSGNQITFAYGTSEAADVFNLGAVDPAQPVNNQFNPSRYKAYSKPSSRTVSGLGLTTQYSYEAAFNKELSTTDAEGNTTSYLIDGQGNRTDVIEPLGKVTKYAYDGDGFVRQVTDPDGRVTTTTRVFNPGDLARYKLVTTTVVGYSGGPVMNLVSSSLSDVLGNTREATDANGNLTTIEYDVLNRQIAVTKPAVQSPTGAPGTLVTSTALTAYDLNGNPVRSTDDEGNVSITTYDLMNRQTAVRRRMTNPSANSAQDLVTGTTYNPVGLPETQTDARGATTTLIYDQLLRLVRTRLPAVTLADLTTPVYEEIREYGANAGSGAFTHWSGWQPTRVINPRGFATDTVYDAIYRPIRSVRRLDTTVGSDAPARAGEPATETAYNRVHKPVRTTVLNENATGGSENQNTYTFSDALYRPTLTLVDLDGDGAGLAAGTPVDSGLTQVVDGDDLVTRMVYDLAGNVTTVRDAENRTTITDYDGAGRAFVVRLPQVEVVDPAGYNPDGLYVPVLTSAYDANGNKTVVEDANHTRTRTTYDARNRPVMTVLDLNGDGVYSEAVNGADIVTRTRYSLVSKPLSVTDSRGNTTTTEFDRAYRVTAMVQPAVADAENGDVLVAPRTETTYDDNGNVRTTKDARGVVTDKTYDEWNRVRTVTAALGTPVAVTTESQYDANGNVTALILHNNSSGGAQRTNYVFDAFDRRTIETLPTVLDGLARQTQTAYFRNGQVRQVTDAKGQTTTSIIDRASRVDSVVLRRADASVEETRNFTYTKVSKPLTISDRAGTTSFAYDALDRILSETRLNTGSAAYTVTSRYDANGNRTRCSYPETGRSLSSRYDRASRLLQVIDGGQTTTYSYDANGNRLSCTTPNGVQTRNTFDALNRVTSANTLTGLASTVASFTYRYDLVGNRRRIDENLAVQGSRKLKYDYDNQYRLTREAWGPNHDVFTYDLAGNRLTFSTKRRGAPVVTTSTYDRLNRLLSHTTAKVLISYTYDLAGNRTSKQVGAAAPTVSTWDVANRLVAVDLTNDGSADFNAIYDYRTRRVRTVDAGVTTGFRYDGGDSFQEVTATGAVAVEFIRGSGMGGGIGSILYSDRTRSGGPVETFTYSPAVGHTVALTNSTGGVLKTDRYAAFGATESSSGASANNRLANTKERSASIGLDNHGFRYYDPAIGRYISRDPIGYRDGANVYVYARNNPVNFMDPLGLWSLWGAIKSGASAVASGVADTAAVITDAATGVVAATAYAVSGNPDAMNMATSFSDTSKALDSGELSVSDAFKDATPLVRTVENGAAAVAAASEGDFSKAIDLASDAAVNAVQDLALKRLPGVSNAVDKLRGKKAGGGSDYQANTKLGDGGGGGIPPEGVPTTVNPKDLTHRQAWHENDPDKVNEFTDAMKKDGYGTFPPVEVGDLDGKTVIIDGHHRATAAQNAGLESIPAVKSEIPDDNKQWYRDNITDAERD